MIRNALCCMALFVGDLVLADSGVANAAPPVGQPVDPAMRDWYKSLQQPGTGAGCCSIADCRPYESRVVSDPYEIWVHDKWIYVPNSVVPRGENRAGTAVACLRTHWNYSLVLAPADFSPGVLCFVPGPNA